MLIGCVYESYKHPISICSASSTARLLLCAEEQLLGATAPLLGGTAPLRGGAVAPLRGGATDLLRGGAARLLLSKTSLNDSDSHNERKSIAYLSLASASLGLAWLGLPSQLIFWLGLALALVLPLA